MNFCNFVGYVYLKGGIIVFYDNFVNLCNKVGKAPSVVAVEIGFQKSVVTRWKKNNVTPTDANLARIADYFGVSVNELLGGDDNHTHWRALNVRGEKEKPAAKSDEQDILDEVDIALYGEYKELSDDEKDVVRDMVRVMRERRAKKQGR